MCSRRACYATRIIRGVPLGAGERAYWKPLLSGGDEDSVMESEDRRYWMKSLSLLCHKHDQR